MKKNENIPNSEPSVFAETQYFNKRMIKFYNEGKLPSIFKPYMDWKSGDNCIDEINKDSAWRMRETAKELLEVYYDKHLEAFSNVELYHYIPGKYNIEDSLWCQYKGFGEDMYIVSFLEAIDRELSEFIIGNILTD